MRNRQSHFYLLLLAVTVTLTISVGCLEPSSPMDVDLTKKLAGELRDHKLFASAIEEYQKILLHGSIDEKQRGSINYLIAKIYFEDIKDYQQAAAFYVRARVLDPNGSYVDEASRKLVASLEKSGQIFDATRQLAALTDIDGSDSTQAGVAVARISGNEIFLADVQAQIQTLPDAIQKQLADDRQARVEFTRQYVSMELLYRAAIREGYDEYPIIKQRQKALMRSAVIDKFIVDKIMPKVVLDTSDVRNFYLAHKVDLYGGAEYDSVKTQVFIDYQSQKAEAAYGEYIGKLAEAERL
ncbi:MAG: hypothetical protein V3T31_07565, partial [candidate division Zixibacteria bacterium]